jgi:hypothetical protein
MVQTDKRPPQVDPVMRDIRSGMEWSSLKRKHGLSDEELHSAYQRYAALSASRTHREGASWTCPACGFPQPNAVEECPRCGIVVAKFSDGARVDARCKSIRATWQNETASTKKSSWVTVAATVFLCLIAGGALLMWTSGHRQENTKIAQAPTQDAAGLKTFTYDNLQQEVVAVSRNRPVIVEFYSSH